jgi:DNA-binding NarL/FixJ family response regulator
VVTGSNACGSVLLAEDDECFRSYIADGLRAAAYEVMEAATGPEAAACADRERPDHAVLDVVLPGISGYEVCRRLRERFGEELPITFMSGERVEPFDRVGGLLLGADDYLVKPFEIDELLALMLRRRRRVADGPTSSGGAELTRRQLEVLRLLAEGLDQNEIGARLVISPKTVGAHIEHIFVKLGVHSRAEAVAFAYRLKLVPVPA